MASLTQTELQNRIHNLQSQLAELSLQLESAQSAEQSADRPLLQTAVGSSSEAGEEFSRERSLRILHDLLWQGRAGLAFHLAKALEQQRASDGSFPSTAIRAWALATESDRRRPEDAVEMMELILAEPVPDADDAGLAHRLFQWATIIGLIANVEPDAVPECAARFCVPSGFPETEAWWHDYVEFLAHRPRRSPQWRRVPEHEGVAGELDQLMLEGPIEPVRLAASCLRMAIRRARRCIRVSGRQAERFIMNAELARATSLSFTEQGEPAAEPAAVERAVCELALATTTGRPFEIVSQDELLVENVEPPTPRAATALIRLEQMQATLESALGTDGNEHENEKPAERPIPSEPNAEARRAAARERLKRYAERLAQRNTPTIPFPVASGGRPPAPERLTLAEGTAGTPSVVLFGESRVPERGAETFENRVAVETPVMSQRGIHESVVASAFGADINRNVTAGLKATATRHHEKDSLWSLLLTPQAAVVAGLLAIAGAVIVGMGSGLADGEVIRTETAAARTAEADAVQESQADFEPVQ